MAKKEAEEADFRAKVAANPEWQKQYGDVWDTIAKVEEEVKRRRSKASSSAAPTAACLASR